MARKRQTRKRRTDGRSCNVERNATTGLPVNRLALTSWDFQAVKGEEAVEEKLEKELDLDDKGILCCLSDAIDDEDLALLWENTVMEDVVMPFTQRMSRLVLLVSNAAARAAGFFPCDVPLVLFSLFDAALSGLEEKDRFLERVMPQRKENLDSFSFRDFACSCLKMAILLSSLADGSKIDPAIAKNALEPLRTSMAAGYDKKQPIIRPAIRANFKEAITRLKPPRADKLPDVKFKTREDKPSVREYLDKYEELSVFSRLMRIWSSNITNIDNNVTRMIGLMNRFWSLEKLDVVQSRLFLDGFVVQSYLKENIKTAGSGVLSKPEAPRTFRIFLNHIRSLMAFPFNYELEYFDADDVGFLWPFRQLEKVIESTYYRDLLLEEKLEAFLLISRLVVQRWNLICSIIKSSLGPAEYGEKWEKTSGREYVKRLSTMLHRGRPPILSPAQKETPETAMPVNDRVSPALLFALSFPREYPLAARPVVEFKRSGSRHLPVLSDTFIFPKVANAFTEEFNVNISARVNTPKFRYFKDAPVADPMVVEKDEMRKYFAYMENTYL